MEGTSLLPARTSDPKDGVGPLLLGHLPTFAQLINSFVLQSLRRPLRDLGLAGLRTVPVPVLGGERPCGRLTNIDTCSSRGTTILVGGPTAVLAWACTAWCLAHLSASAGDGTGDE